MYNNSFHKIILYFAILVLLLNIPTTAFASNNDDYLKYLTDKGYTILESKSYNHELEHDPLYPDGEAFNPFIPPNINVPNGVIGMKLSDFDGDGIDDMLVVISEESINAISLIILKKQNGVIIEGGAIKIGTLIDGIAKGYCDIFIKSFDGKNMIGIEEYSASTFWSDGKEFKFDAYEYKNELFTKVVNELIFEEELYENEEYQIINNFKSINNQIKASTGFDRKPISTENYFNDFYERTIKYDQQVEVLCSIDYDFQGDYDEVAEIMYGDNTQKIPIYIVKMNTSTTANTQNTIPSTSTVIVTESNETSPSTISVEVDGKLLVFDQPPIIENDRTLVPLRATFEALGAEVEWEQSTQTITAVKDNTNISLVIGISNMIVDGASVILEVPPKIIGDRTLIPIRAVAEAFGALVGWNPNTQTVTIVTSTKTKSPDSYFNPSITLYEAQQKYQGTYIMDGDRFVLIDNKDSIINLAVCNSSSDDVGVFLVDADYDIPRIPNTSQLVFIGHYQPAGAGGGAISIVEAASTGYTIPFEVSIDVFGGFKIEKYRNLGTASEVFEEINGMKPNDFAYRLLNFGTIRWSTNRSIIEANKNEKFIFGRFDGTSWKEDEIIANKRYFTHDNRYREGSMFSGHANDPEGKLYEVEQTRDGYFKLNFYKPPVGVYCIRDGFGKVSSVFEFVKP